MTRWPNEGENTVPDGDEDDDGLEELEGEWELDPNDPTHPDHDLSESSGYGFWEPRSKPFLLRRGVVLGLTILVLIGLMIPLIRIF